MTMVETPAELVTRAVELARQFLRGKELDAAELTDSIAGEIADTSLASLAIWQLLHSGDLEFTSRERRRVRLHEARPQPPAETADAGA